MPDQFVVPQFIDAEDKILGPVTARQFIILLVAFLIDAILYKLLRFVPFLMVGLPFFVFSMVVAFVRINGQPFHYFILNLVQTFRRPRLRVWDKNLNTSEVKLYMKSKPPEPKPAPKRKEKLTTSRLQELSLVVNTGGVYNPDE